MPYIPSNITQNPIEIDKHMGNVTSLMYPPLRKSIVLSAFACGTISRWWQSPCPSQFSWSTFDLVGGKTTPLKNMSSAVGMIIPNVMSKTPTSDSPQKMFFL